MATDMKRPTQPLPVYVVTAIFDEETSRWTATSNDIPGLVIEAGSMEEVKRCVQDLAPQLLELNNPDFEQDEVPIMLQSSFWIHSEPTLAAE